MDSTLDLSKLLHILKKNLWVLIGLPILFLVISAIITFLLMTPKYQATTQILVNPKQTNDNMLQQNVQGTLQQVNTYAEIVTSPRILDKSAKKLDKKYTAEELEEKVTVESSAESQVIKVHVTDKDKRESEKIANTIAKEYRDEMPDIMNVDNVTILSDADNTAEKVSPKSVLNLVVALFLGLIIALLYIFIKELTDTRIKDEQDIEDHLKLPVLGTIKRF
ncbi:YveK family protein [Staphylococcus chromogenes]|uniref:YveK family protein n=1 Tax=Staphylococcus chromogenes TaxID=46126 RepID=UPI000D1A0A44|nr:Wzz/FepE/Etk N-terminal domain-containing protein [Staphylococcus chromogenes]MDT0698784.1 Wzz/FepE/Etk N-terminal domain-containing protein [Staphylococcus chromogenes]MDT0736757.1 Wzz/FepE/Etk N-terminal domain-containing protein [Staphylococcus chromogenes]MDT0750845.1 Wzz/FepE/Etk N-terminal domain-containing protein [Staphylococcus chromogenes]PTG20081.1 capsule biosynthesis protein CapA [Staphylococcus chromogenes]QDW90840.1 capsule biosynthesis protein CapA [Staphylococcus chromogene